MHRRRGVDELALTLHYLTFASQIFASWDALDEDVFAAEEFITTSAVSRGKAREAFRESEALRMQNLQREATKGASARDKRLAAHPAAKYDKVQEKKPAA